MGKFNSIKIVIHNLSREYLETITVINLDNFDETIKKFSSIKESLEAKIIAINQSISVDQLLIQLLKEREKLKISCFQ